MKIGLQTRQWLLLFLVLSLPLFLNGVAIWLDIGTEGTLQLLRGTYQPSNPNLPLVSLIEILLDLLINIAVLGLLSWLVIFISNRPFFQKQRLIAKFLETFLIALLVAKAFEIVTGFFMPFSWLSEFHDLIGLPGSSFTLSWSRWFIFPTTAIILFLALTSPRSKKLEVKA